MTKVELSGVLRAHASYDDTAYQCRCGWRNDEWVEIDDKPTHTEHLADVVLAWVAAQASGFAVQRFDERGPMDVRGAALWDFAAWVTEDAHAGSGAAAGVEVAPGATGELAGAQISFPQLLPLIGDHRPMWDRGQLGTTDSGEAARGTE